MEKRVPARMCVACRSMKAPKELMRFVRDSETGEVKPDFDKKLFGRGAYICKNAKCLKLAKKRRGLERHFGCAVSADVYGAAEDLVFALGSDWEENDRKG